MVWDFQYLASVCYSGTVLLMTMESSLTVTELKELAKVNIKNIKSSFVLIESNNLAKAMLAAKFLAGEIYSSTESWRDYKEFEARNGKWKAEDAEETIKFSGIVRPIEQHVIVLKNLDYYERGFFDKMLVKLEDSAINLTMIGIVSNSSIIPKTILSRCLHIYKLEKSSKDPKDEGCAELIAMLGNSLLWEDFDSAVENFIEKNESDNAAELVSIFEKIHKEKNANTQSNKLSDAMLEHIKVKAHLKVLKSRIKLLEKEKKMDEITMAVLVSKSAVPLSYIIYRVKEILK